MDILKLLKKAGIVAETKANEVMHSGNTGYGAEFVPTQTFVKGIIDILPEYSTLISLLPGNHGSNLPKVLTKAARGLTMGDTLFKGRTEWTTGRSSDAEAKHSQSKVKTPTVTLTQKGFICEIDITDDDLRYSAEDLEDFLKKELARGMALTVDGVIINGDTTTAGTGNVNSDDQAPATTYGADHYSLQIDGGIRKKAIAGAYTKDFGTLADTDYSDLLGLMGRYATNPKDCLFIQPIQVTNKAKSLDNFKLITNSGDKASLQSGLTPTPYGVDILNHHLVPLTEADGKLSGATPANNVKGQTIGLYKPAVQYGFGKDFTLETVRVPGYGYRLVATFDFAFSILESAASQTETPVAAGINITL